MKAKKLLSKYLAEAGDGCSGASSCPAIIEAEDGSFFIIGKKPTEEIELNGFACVAEDEQLVIIPREVLIKAKEMLS